MDRTRLQQVGLSAAKGIAATLGVPLVGYDHIAAHLYACRLAHPGAVIFDCAVEKEESCFPMIPSGAAHNEMILAAGQSGGVAGVTDEGKVLV